MIVFATTFAEANIRNMKYYTKEDGEAIQDHFSYLTGQACCYNDSKEKVVLSEIIVGPSGDIIEANGRQCMGYNMVFRFENAVILTPNLFFHFNDLEAINKPYEALNPINLL